MSEIKRRLLDLRSKVLKPIPKISLVEWADTNRHLSKESSSTPGRWSTDVIEVARGPMMAVTEKGIRRITVMGPTQVLKTELINNIVGYYIHQDPSPIIVMQPNEKLAKEYSTERLDKMLRDSPCFKGLVKEKRERDSGNTIFSKQFPGGRISIVSAGSATDVASRPARLVLMDEIDKYNNLPKEGDPEYLLEKRVETFWNSLIVKVCSPTVEGTSRIEKNFLAGDQRHFHAKCPHCGEFDKLTWQQVKWEEGNPKSAHYECPKCFQKWTEFDRLGAIKNGKYIAEKPFNGHASFHVNAIASPWKTLVELVQDFLQAKKDDKLQEFINTKMAETWKMKIEVPEWEHLYDRREPFTIGEVPTKDIKFITCGADVQADRIEAQVVGWGKDKQSWVLDYKVFIGPTHTLEPYKEFEKFIKNMYKIAGTDLYLPISLSVIDSNFNTQHVYDFVSKFHPNLLRAIKGSDSLNQYWRMGGDLTYSFNGAKIASGHKLWMVGSSFMKQHLYQNLKLHKGDEAPPNYIHLPNNLDPDFFKGLVGEQLVKEKNKWVWVKKVQRNEALDTFNYARAAASMFGLDRFTPGEWAALEGLARTEEFMNKKQEPEIKTPVKKTQPKPNRFGTSGQKGGRFNGGGNNNNGRGF